MGGGSDMWQLYAPPEAPGGLDPATRQRLLAQAAALRRQEQLGTVAAFTGDKVLAPYGQQLLAQARQGGEDLAAVPEKRALQRLRELQGRKELVDVTGAEADQARTTNPGTVASQTARQLLAKFMPGSKVSPGATAADLMPALGLAEKGYQVDENARQRALTRAAIGQRMSGNVDQLTGEPLDILAKRYLADGTLPAMGMGAAGAALKVAIVKRAAELNPQADVASAAASYKADSGSLKKLQQQADAIGAFERTALANGDLFMQKARGLGIDTGSPLFNAPARKFAEKVSGDPKMAEFTAAREVFVQEISKILSGSMGNAAVSDSARHEAASLLSPDASLAQIEAAFSLLKKDMANRKQGLADQLQEIRGRGKAAAPAPVQTSAPGAAAGWTPEKQKRLEELRAKQAAGGLR